MSWLKSVLVASVLLAQSAHAAIIVDNAKARATFALAKTGAVYMDIVNKGDADDTLTHVSVPAETAESAEIHTIMMSGDMMQMREMEDGLPLYAGQVTHLLPGGYHLMLIGLTEPLNEGNEITLTLHFAESADVDVRVPIVKM